MFQSTDSPTERWRPRPLFATPTRVRDGVPPGKSGTYSVGSDGFLLAAAAVVMATHILEGPLRFGLVAARAQLVLYVRDLVMAALIACGLVSWPRRVEAAPLVATCAIVFCHFLIGLLTLPSPLQPVIGLKCFLPLLLGVAIAPLIQRHSTGFVHFATATFLVTVVGVIVNAFVDYPWVGLLYDARLTTVEVSRSWHSAGSLRIPGFTRASFVASGITILSLVPTLAATRSRSIKALLLLAAGAAVALTTTKAAWTGLAILLATELIMHLAGLWAWAASIAALAVGCLALPLASSNLHLEERRVPSWQISFVARVEDMWPRAFKLLEDPTQMLWGRGLGGVGMPQTISEPSKYNASDNIMVFVLVTFGILGLIYVGTFLVMSVRHLLSRPAADLTAGFLRGWIAILFSVGLTTNMLEDTTTAVTVGICLGMVFAHFNASGRSWTRNSSPSQVHHSATRDPRLATAFFPAPPPHHTS